MDRFRTPRNRNAAFLARRVMLLLAALGLAAGFAAAAFAQGFARPDGSIPVPIDWSSRHVIFTGGYTPEQMVTTWNEPRAYAQWLLHGNAPADSGLVRGRRRLREPERRRPRGDMRKDWAVSLGGGGVAQGMWPAKYSFNVNATPSCTADFVVFPVNASTGNTRANVVGTFTTGAPISGQTATITITPTGGAAVTLTLTASTTTNTGLDFEVSGTAAANATNLAAAINRNLSNTALDRVVAVASGTTVTVYSLTPGTRVALTAAETLNHFGWGTITAGINGTQANIVAFNHLYSGSGTPLCLTNPEFIFSYASGVGPVATSPGLSVSGTEVAYVENDPNIGAILHVLTFSSGSTEYGTSASCTGNNNGGATLPTCATSPVIPGSTSGSTATDFMLPLGLVAANAATGAAGAADSFSSPFTDYANDTTYVGDNNGYLYAITPTFKGTPAHAGGNFPVHVNAIAPVSDTPTQVTATTSVVTVTVTNTLAIGESVTVAGVTANTGNGCSAADAAAINGPQVPITASGAQLTFNATIPTATTGGGCTVTGATVTQGSNFLSSPVVDVGSTGDIFIGDSSSNFYEISAAGVTEATLALGISGATNQGMINGGIRDGAILDSTNSVGYVVSACSPNTSAASGETDTGTAGNPGLVQFKFTSNTLTSVTITGLDSGANQSCTTAGFPLYAPTPDNRYFTLGIGSATEANNGEIIGASSGTGGQQLKPFSFVSSVLQAAPLGKPQLGNNASVMSPLTEFYNASAGVDYLFVGVNANPTELYTFALPNPLEIAQGDTPTALATNTADVAGGTSGIIVDNDSTDAQASSIYFGTLATSTTICGSTAAYCAVKLTQSGLD
ncbi:MAG: hypothetical protein WAK89_15035 [Candidatus Sulfotelmatobacter sp.]